MDFFKLAAETFQTQDRGGVRGGFACKQTSGREDVKTTPLQGSIPNENFFLLESAYLE